MRLNKSNTIGSISLIAFILLIVFSKEAVSGAKDGVVLCLQSVIPSLFPFVFITSVLNVGTIAGFGNLYRLLRKLCKIPNGCENILVMGILGGYPVGAKNVMEYYHKGLIPESDVMRMLTFCNNAGPSFIFGVLYAYFPDKLTLFVLWGIQISTAILLGAVIPGQTSTCINTHIHQNTSFSSAIQQSVKIMGTICGWVILFRTILVSLPTFIPPVTYSIISGFLEITNGCTSLSRIASPAVRFIIASGVLSFGGLCVLMQTATIISPVSLRPYLIGKLMQCSCSLIIATVIQYIIFSKPTCTQFSIGIIIISAILLASCLYIYKKTVAFP